MKKKGMGAILALVMALLMTMTAMANPVDAINALLNKQDAAVTEGDDPGAMPGGEIPGEGQSPEGQSPEGQSPAGEQETQIVDGPHIIRDDPVSTMEGVYGTDLVFDAEKASDSALKVSSGNQSMDGLMLLTWEGSAVEASANASLTVRNSYIRGETDAETQPLAGNPGNLLVAGNIRTTLGIGNSQNIYINSTIASRNWAALSTDAAQPALEEEQKELSLYAYGTEAITMDGGYGAYSDLFCNLFVYGSHIQAAEIGIISGTYGKVTVGTIEEGENDPAVYAVLTGADRDKRPAKKLGSVIEGGRNALMIHSVNLPPYWEYEGYSKERRFSGVMHRGWMHCLCMQYLRGGISGPDSGDGA